MIQVKVNNVVQKIVWDSLTVKQNLTNQVDTCNFQVKKFGSRTFVPAYNDDVIVYDDSTIVFAGKILKVVRSPLVKSEGVVFNVACVDHIYEADRDLIARVFENETVGDIIATMVSDVNASLGTSFTSNNATSTFVMEKIVFNQLPLSLCLRKLARVLRYDWYIDEDKDVHFFNRETNPAPFDLSDDNGNKVTKSLKMSFDGSQLVNVVKVRGGMYNGAIFTDTITVKGDDTKSFNLPYGFDNLVVELDTGGGFVNQTIGIDNIDDFTTVDVLYNFQEKIIRFENDLSDNDLVKFTGNPKIRVFAIAQDSASITDFGRVEKLIREDDIESNTIARQRANAELLAYNDEAVDAKFNTFTPGLRTGMLIQVQSDNIDVDESVIIKTITFKPLDPFTFGYRVECVSTQRFDLIDILQQLLEPKPLSSDEAEVAEEIFAMNENIFIDDLWEQINPFIPEETLLMLDEWFADPIDPGDIEWVYAPYTLTGVTDTKRIARYSRDSNYE